MTASKNSNKFCNYLTLLTSVNKTCHPDICVNVFSTCKVASVTRYFVQRQILFNVKHSSLAYIYIFFQLNTSPLLSLGSKWGEVRVFPLHVCVCVYIYVCDRKTLTRPVLNLLTKADLYSTEKKLTKNFLILPTFEKR